MAMAVVRWEGGRLKREIRKAVADGMEGLGGLIIYRMRQNLNTPFPPASQPGEFPHKRSGNLRKSVYYRMNRTTLTLGVYANALIAEYWGFLEFGTSRMAARPFIGPTMEELKHRFVKEIIRRARASLR